MQLKQTESAKVVVAVLIISSIECVRFASYFSSLHEHLVFLCMPGEQQVWQDVGDKSSPA